MDLVTTIVQALVPMLVMVLLFSLVGRWAKSGSPATTLERFRVQTPLVYRKIFLAGAAAFEASFAVVAVLSAGDSRLFDPSFLCLGTTCALVCLGIWLVCTLQFVEVDGAMLTCRSKVGRTNRLAINDIERATRASSGALRLYAKNRCVARLSGDCANINMLAERLEAEDIAVEAHEQAPCTAFALYREAVSVFIGISVGITLFLLLLFASLVLAGTFPWWSLAFALATGAGIFVFVVGLCSLVPARGLIQLKAQERTLGFSFADEMAKRGVTGVGFCDEEWFVRVGACAIVAFRRDYVKRVSVARHGPKGWECRLTDYKGGTHIVRADQATLKALRAWTVV